MSKADFKEIWGITYTIPEYQAALISHKTRKDRCAILASWALKTGLISDSPECFEILTEMIASGDCGGVHE